MEIYIKPTNADSVPCPYISGNEFIQRYSVLNKLDPDEIDFLFENGWRHFGMFFFIPNCEQCKECRPIRTVINHFTPSKSQRRNLKKNNEIIETEFIDPIFSDEIYNIYKKHSLVKFNQKTSKDDFKESFFSNVLPGNQKMSLFRYNGKLVGLGFLDISKNGISSIYFCYDTDYSKLGLGVYSVLKEIEYGLSLDKSYYYLGYFVKGNNSMEYKGKYTPSEILDWSKNSWVVFK